MISALTEIRSTNAITSRNFPLPHYPVFAARSRLIWVSGSGKSSLLNAMIAELDLAIGQLNDNERGCHITRESIWFQQGK